MLKTLTAQIDGASEQWATRFFFVAATVLVASYFWFVWVSGVLHQLRSSRIFPAALVLALAPATYVAVLWFKRDQLIRLDRHMAYLPILCWFVAAMIGKWIMWMAFQGQAVWGPYGRDKSLSNAVVEPMLVVFCSGLYLLRFLLPRRADSERVSAVASKLFWLVVAFSVAIALAFPPLPQ